jgi:hypothetical protein
MVAASCCADRDPEVYRARRRCASRICSSAGDFFLADVQLSKGRKNVEAVIAARVLAFEDFAITPCTSYLDFHGELARMMAAGLRKGSTVPMAERASAQPKSELGTGWPSGALQRRVGEGGALLARLAGGAEASPAS